MQVTKHLLLLVTLFATNVSASTLDFTSIGECASPATLISEIQGDSDVSPKVDTEVVVEAVVTLVAPGLQGFFLQEEVDDFDTNPNSSEGIFVFTANMPIAVKERELVRVGGSVTESFEKTQLNLKAISNSCGTANYQTSVLTLPLSKGQSFEAFEGMAVTVEQTLTVVNTYNYTRFGEIEVANGRLFTPTHLFAPGSPEALALASENSRNKITLDDLFNGAPESVDLNGQLSADNPLRTGSTISGIQGVIDYSFNVYRIRSTATPNLSSAPRPEVPKIKGDIKIASFNVLNLFNGDGKGGEFPTPRGADNIAEYNLQLAKIVNAILPLDADVVALMELENDGFGSHSAIAQLVEALNTELGSDVYDYINAGKPLGTDKIAVGIIYQPAKVSSLGAVEILDESKSLRDEQGPLFNTRRNRPALAQKFTVGNSENTFVVNVNHLKSKGSSCGEGDDSADQGNCNGTRTRAAKALQHWLAATFSNQPVFIVGDLNAYAKEDPIIELAKAGYTDLARELNGPKAYSYAFRGNFGSLDYALANTAALELVTSTVEWHINADEPIALDYNDELPGGAKKPDSYNDKSAFRSSDHDPVIVGFSFAPKSITQATTN